MYKDTYTTADALEAAVSPRRVEAHTEEPNEDGLPTALTQKPVERKSPAEWAYERLILYIQNFEKMLDADHEVAMGFAGGEAGVLRIEGMGFFEPDIITFYGTDPTGARTQLVQHVSQLSVMLRALPREVRDDKPARRIGFKLAQTLESEEKAT
ncbi:MAG: DUF6173 family protein [Marinovum sp.]|nr:DUF6173 family protein [Marinovum sp.]